MLELLEVWGSGSGADADADADAVELLEKNAALRYDCGGVLLKLLLMEDAMLCAGRVDVMLRGRACEACMRHRAQSRVTSRRAIAVAAGERIVVFW